VQRIPLDRIYRICSDSRTVIAAKAELPKTTTESVLVGKGMHTLEKLSGYETWSLTLREERKLRVFENMVLRRIFGPRRDEVTGEWRRLHNEQLNDLLSSPNIVQVIKSRRMRWAGHVACMGEEREVYRVLVGTPEGRRPLGRPRRRWVDNITMDLQEVGCGYIDWIGLAQDRDRWRTLVRAVMNLRVP